MNKQEKLSKEARAERNAYMKEWREKNPEKVKQNNRNYWERKAQEREQQQEEA